ncbi:MAG: YdgA family protein [Thermodesulfobacteriota bacterium]
MKKVIAFILVLILITLGTYLGFGLLAKKNYEAAISEMQANFPGQVESTFEQGLFASELSVLLTIPVPAANPGSPEAISTRIRQTIHHGPFIINSKQPNSSPFTPLQLFAYGTLELEPFMANEPAFISELRQLATTDITVHAPLKGRTKVSFTGRPLHSSLALGSENFDLNWQGFTGQLYLEGSNLLTYDLDFQAPGLEMKGKGAEGIIIKEITTQATMKEGSHNLSMGTITTTMKNLEATLGNGPEDKVTMSGLNLRIANSEKDGLLRVEEKVSMDRLQFSDKKYGPGTLQISLANLDAQAVAKLTEAYKELQANPANDEVMALGLLSSHASALLAKSPEIKIEDFSLTSPEGACQSSAHITFNGDGEVIMNPLFLLGRLSAEADFSADERFLAVQAKNFIKENLCAERTDPDCDHEAAQEGSKQLKALIDQNVLVLKGGKYTLTASFKNGQPMLNGQPVPLSF